MKSVAKGLVMVTALATALPLTSVRIAHATGTTYFVSPTGSDLNTGDSTHPFQHIQKCADVMVAGDTCTINAGTYREKVTPLHSGTATSPITYQPAAGATVRVDGTDYVNGWSQVTGGDLASLEQTNPYLASSPFAGEVNRPSGSTVYKAHATLSTGLVPNSVQSPLVPTTLNTPPPANQIFVNGQMQNEAQWPDPSYAAATLRATPLTPTVEVAQTGSNAAAIVDSKLSQQPGYWTGAHAYVQEGFTADSGVVTASAPGSVAVAGYYGAYADHFDLVCGSITAGNTRYFLWGKLSELNAPTEWFYDDTSSTLYYRPANGATPADNTVSAKTRQLAFDLTNAGYTTITGLQIFGATIKTGPGTQGDTLQSLQVDYPSHFMDFYIDPAQTKSAACDDLSAGVTTTGIILNGTGNTVKDSTIEYSAGNGVALLGSGNTVDNNYIHDVDYSGGRPAGVWVIGDSQHITRNTIANVGRGGIESNSNVTPFVLTNNDISYNDISSFGMLEQDDGAIYTCCNLDMSNTTIHHNWLHDAQTYPGVPYRATIGVYIDGGTNGGASGLVIYDNVGWNISSGTVGLVSNGVVNTRVLNNDGGVFLFGLNSWDAASHVDNNIGEVDLASLASGVTPLQAANLGSVNAHDPKYVDEAARNYTLQTSSPDYGTGVPDAPATTGSTAVSMGAYQPGLAAWQPGASTQQSIAIRPQWGASGMTSTGTWSMPTGGQPTGRMDSHPSNPFADMWPGFPGTDTSTLHFTFPAQTSSRTIDKVYVLLYARMARNLPTTTGNVVLTMPSIGTVFDAGGKDFQDVGAPFKFDITSNVAGSWLNMPTSADLTATLGPEPQLGVVGGPYATIDVYAVEIYVEAH
jgi:Right handed beta helix region